MRVAILENQPGKLKIKEIPKPIPQDEQILVKVLACGLCRTDLHIVDGELKNPKLPLIPGHQIVGRVASKSKRFKEGDYVGIPWLGYACGQCEFCRRGSENLCDEAKFTGYHIDGGFAEYCVADERFCFSLHEESALSVAPLLCAGLIGYRALKKTGDGKVLGLFGFGSSAHLILQVAKKEGKIVYAFTKEGDSKAQDFARQLGADWAGSSLEQAPKLLDSAIIFAPVGKLVIEALKKMQKGGTVVCAGIHMSSIPAFDYDLLWQERVITSVANLTRKDGEEFLPLAHEMHLKSHVTVYPLDKVQQALSDLREGRLVGSAVIQIASE